jgi:hypothetical protein
MNGIEQALRKVRERVTQTLPQLAKAPAYHCNCKEEALVQQFKNEYQL